MCAMPEIVQMGVPVVIAHSVGLGELSGEALLLAGEDAVVLRAAAGEVTIAYSALDGVQFREAQLTLTARGPIILRLDGTARLAATAREIVARTSALPELTLALRGLGSRRASGGVADDGFFAPFLAARRRAERASDLALRLAAFDPAVLAAAVDEMLLRLAATPARRSSDRRALEAHLSELAEPLHASITTLADAAAAWRSSGDESRLARWREWSSALRDLFAEADRCCLSVHALLREWRDEPLPWWRRALHLPG
jgi:hypothetical protein